MERYLNRPCIISSGKDAADPRPKSQLASSFKPSRQGSLMEASWPAGFRVSHGERRHLCVCVNRLLSDMLVTSPR